MGWYIYPGEAAGFWADLYDGGKLVVLLWRADMADLLSAIDQWEQDNA